MRRPRSGVAHLFGQRPLACVGGNSGAKWHELREANVAWSDAAQAATLDLDHRAVPHEAIIKRITTRFVCRERPVRRCLACLDLIRGEDAGSTAQVELLEARFIGYGGSDAYRRRLRRLLGTYLRSVQGSHAQDPKQVHWERLLRVVAKLLAVESLPLHGHELGHWAGRPDEPTWRIGGADVQQDESSLVVLFDAEREDGWDQLRQHFPGDDLWPAIETCRAAIVRDLHARLALFQEIRKRVERPTSIGGVGLKVFDENEAAASIKSVVTVAYVFEILDVLLSRARGIGRQLPRGPQLRLEPPGELYIGSHLGVHAVRSADRTAARRWFSRAPAALRRMEEIEGAASLAAEEYRRGQDAIDALKLEVERLLAREELPPASVCDECVGWRPVPDGERGS